MARLLGSRGTVVKADNVARRQAWQSMRIMRRFTRADILISAEINESNLRKFIKGLLRCNFLDLAQERVSGRPGSVDVLRMARDNGPRPPILHIDGSMTDPNTGERWIPEGAEGFNTEAPDA
jgi:hypothetical protein